MRLKKAYTYFKNKIKSKSANYIIKKAVGILRAFGFKGFFIALKNLLTGRPLLLNVKKNGEVFFIEDIDKRCNNIFRCQQESALQERITEEISRFKKSPLISIIMPLYNPPVLWLKTAIESLQAQYYENWELCAVDDGSTDKQGYALVEKMMKNDGRIKLAALKKNSGISGASNRALTMASGEYIALVDQDDEVTPDAFFWVAKEINENPYVDFIYSDECKIDATEEKSKTGFYFKPDWSPTLLLNHMYIGHLTVYRTELVRAAGGFRSPFDFSQDYDLALRISEMTTQIKHIERVLYFWRTLPSSAASGGKDYARDSNIRAVEAWYTRHGLNVSMEALPYANYGKISLSETPKVSIIIPTDSGNNLKRCIQGILKKTSYKNIEIVAVTNSKTADEVLANYPDRHNLIICRYDKPFNFSDKCNEGAAVSSGEVLCFFNDDVAPFHTDWLERQLEALALTGVGGVSPLLLHKDRTVQYAGMITGTPGIVGMTFSSRPFNIPVANVFSHLLIRDVSVLCSACICIKKENFALIGGFDAVNTPNRHSNLDFSLKLIEKGLRCVYTPYSILLHIGKHSLTEKNKKDKADIYCIKRWGKFLERDPYFTDSMKKILYAEFQYKYKMYTPEQLTVPASKAARDILFVTHELARTGAPIVLKEFVQFVLENGDFPVILSAEDGPLKQEFLEMGVAVIIDESFLSASWMFEHFARNFDLIIANTAACSSAVNMLRDSLPPVIWWIHEGFYALKQFQIILPPTLSSNIHVYCGGEYAQRALQDFCPQYDSKILMYGLQDRASGLPLATHNKYKTSDKLLFAAIGTIEERKGQDILGDALLSMPRNMIESAEFLIVGRIFDKHIYEKLLDLQKQYPDNITILNEVSHDEINVIFSESNCILCTSRDDPMPVFITEGMMFSKLCICSENTGTAFLIKDGENGFVYQNNDPSKLAEKIEFVINHFDELDDMRAKSRLIYEKNFAMNVFYDNTQKLLDNIFKD